MIPNSASGTRVAVLISRIRVEEKLLLEALRDPRHVNFVNVHHESPL